MDRLTTARRVSDGHAVIRGVVGQVKWVYYVAAAINGYTVVRGAGRRWRLRGTVVLRDPYNLARRPLTFVAPTATGEWAWPILDHALVGDVLRAELGPLEVLKHGIVVRST